MELALREQSLITLNPQDGLLDGRLLDGGLLDGRRLDGGLLDGGLLDGGLLDGGLLHGDHPDAEERWGSGLGEIQHL